MMKRKICFLTLLLLALMGVLPISAQQQKKNVLAPRWTEAKANAWYAPLPWMSGCDYIPATAINQIEMWSKDTYDHPQIDKELGWAEELGFKTMRVFLSSVVYEHDPQGLKDRMNDFLEICNRHGIRPLFVFFDDCWNAESSYGKQPDPKPGVHNSGWVRDPSMSLRKDTVTLYRNLSKYVKDILTTFGNDKRVLMWDLYNEPGNSDQKTASLPLLRKVFEWARSVNPSQPLTAGVWNLSKDFAPLNAFQLEHSDVISYHNYDPAYKHSEEIKYLGALNRPLICTEYMARRGGSLFSSVMPLLKANKVIAINWGFVSGKTNTIFAWGTPIPDGHEPELWFHDIYRQNKTPFDPEEIKLIKKLNGK
jgi:hypothetical protein